VLEYFLSFSLTFRLKIFTFSLLSASFLNLRFAWKLVGRSVESSVLCSGFRPVDRSLGANRAKAEKEQKVAENKKKGEDGITSLNVWAENPNCTEAVVWRVDTLKLLPTLEQQELLLRLAKATRVLITREHARRRQLYERSGDIDCSVKSAYWDPSYAELVEFIGSKNFDEALYLVAESWRSFKELLKLKERGELPAWLDLKPPKRLKSLIIAVKYDNYRLLEDEKAIWLKYYNIKLKFEGDLRWWRQRIQQGRLIVAYDEVKGA
jgi:hypothetical protein